MATNPADVSTGFTTAERTLVANAVLAKCDALDGATDGMVQDTAACQAAFGLDRDVPTCTGARDGSCLSAAQKTAVGAVFAGATTGTGTRDLRALPVRHRPGHQRLGPAWKFGAPPTRDAGAVAFIWQVPPEDPATFNGTAFALNGSIDAMLAKSRRPAPAYPESALSFMPPPNNGTDLAALKNRGAKMLVYHGMSDPIFSASDTIEWYRGVQAANGGDASDFARYYPVPGMNHCSGGPATDQFDLLTAARRLGRAGTGAGRGGRQRARRRQRRRRQRRPAGRLGRQPHPAAVPVAAGGEIQGQRQRRGRGQLRLPVSRTRGCRGTRATCASPLPRTGGRGRRSSPGRLPRTHHDASKETT